MKNQIVLIVLMVALLITATAFTVASKFIDTTYKEYVVQEGEDIYSITKDISYSTRYTYEYVFSCILEKNNISVNEDINLIPGTIIIVPTIEE